MKFSLAPVFVLVAIAAALPSSSLNARDASAVAVTEPIPNAEAFAAALAEARAYAAADAEAFPVEVDAEAVSNPLEKRLNKAQCKAACRGGAEAMERICRLVPLPWIRAVCWGIAAGVQTPAGLAACTAFCDWAV
ncbi:hypothetical protein BJ508DRAFT_43632 [Ascobolus immersus RN42]|uniref:Fungal calcium binding protein domain-containing protein n=1 Tax=Ascobolus immersus RN42 TaxID=1160509 RepID=A0A3N4IJC6_ASCIM|nr:hypothetical protein BJ508DRAFT_43632 [Ascobolus immersus RN42]